MSYSISPTADVAKSATIGYGTRIWNWVQVCPNAIIGENCILAKGVYIDTGVIIGDRVKIQNNVSIFKGVTIKDEVFIGPHVCFTNDKYPESVNRNGTLKTARDWEISETRVCKGASIGANSTILPGITIGEYAMIGAGSVVTKDVPDFATVYGAAAEIRES